MKIYLIEEIVVRREEYLITSSLSLYDTLAQLKDEDVVTIVYKID